MNKIKIQYISDLHLEKLCNHNKMQDIIHQIRPLSNTLVIAGDIGNPYDTNYDEFLFNMNRKFEKIFIVAGNHEYHHNDIHFTKKQIIYTCNQYQNITFLDNSMENYMGVRWIGSTLWSRINNTNNTNYDTCVIKNFDNKQRNMYHEESKKYIEKTLEKTCKPAIIITHMVPSYDLTHEKYRNKKNLQFFNADMNDIINKNRHIKAWFYGHTHMVSVNKFNNTFCCCNPLGTYKKNKNLNMLHEVEL